MRHLVFTGVVSLYWHCYFFYIAHFHQFVCISINDHIVQTYVFVKYSNALIIPVVECHTFSDSDSDIFTVCFMMTALLAITEQSINRIYKICLKNIASMI